MSFTGDQSNPMSGLQSVVTGVFSKLGTFLGGMGKDRGDAGPDLPVGRKPKAKGPVASFLGSDATPSGGGNTTLLGG